MYKLTECRLKNMILPNTLSLLAQLAWLHTRIIANTFSYRKDTVEHGMFLTGLPGKDQLFYKIPPSSFIVQSVSITFTDLIYMAVN